MVLEKGENIVTIQKLIGELYEYNTDCPKKKIAIGLSASIAYKIVNQSEYALEL